MCCFFTSGPWLWFFFETKTQTNLITPGNQVFKRFFFSSNGFFLSGFSFWFPDLWFHKFFLAFMAFLFWLFLFFLRCTTQLQLTAAHSTTAYRPQSFDEITQSVWSERYKYSKVFGFNCPIILKYLMKKTKKEYILAKNVQLIPLFILPWQNKVGGRELSELRVKAEFWQIFKGKYANFISYK